MQLNIDIYTLCTHMPLKEQIWGASATLSVLVLGARWWSLVGGTVKEILDSSPEAHSLVL